VPAETPWPALLQWLVEQALPEHVPGAMLRARRQLTSDHTLMTRRERAGHNALTDLETDYSTRRSDLARELGDAQAAASPMRDALLYGPGKPLVDAVGSVLESAGVTVVDLDDRLGGTKNADLLCSYGGRSPLVE
jgi:serine/threonine protein phosphatase PrpC